MSKRADDPREHPRSPRPKPGAADYERRQDTAKPARRAGTLVVPRGTREALTTAPASAASALRSNRRAVRLSRDTATPKAKE